MSKTVGDIDKRFFEFNFQLKKLDGEFFFGLLVYRNPVTGYLLGIFGIKFEEKKTKLVFFPGIHQNIFQAVNVYTIVI